MTNPAPSPSEETARERALPKFVHVVIRCAYCSADQPFWGNAVAAEMQRETLGAADVSNTGRDE